MSWRQQGFGAAVLAAICATTPVAHAQVSLKSFQAEPEAWHSGTWAGWQAAFLMPDGRVVDNGNGSISHSEGQGYGMLLAVIANDRRAFEKIYGWTRMNMMTRIDGLASWKWEPGKAPNITDPNNASDGDLLIAWALFEAAKRWSLPDWQNDAVQLVTALDQKVGIRSALGRVMLPGVDGFTEAHRHVEEDGPVVNPSYWIFPALERLQRAAPKVDWEGYRAGGYTLIRAARFGSAGLSTEWVSLKQGMAAPAKGFPPKFSYNAVRIPLYLAWAKRDAKDLLQPYVAHYVNNGGKVFEYDTVTNANGPEMADPGYRTIFALAKCAYDGEQIPVGLRSVSFDRYYSATLHMLALAAARLRFDKCL